MTKKKFVLEEATIDDVHAAFASIKADQRQPFGEQSRVLARREVAIATPTLK